MKLKLAMVAMIIGLAISQASVAQINVPQRFVQIRSINLTTSVLELYNAGTNDQPLSGWRFCSHDENEVRRYSATGGLARVTLGPNESLFVHFNNDADTTDETSINISAIGGSFALPMDAEGAYGIQIYFQTPFGVGTNIADHLQFSLDGVDNTSADDRSDEAQSGGTWTDQSQWISIQADTELITVNKDVMINEIHGPDDFTVTNPVTVTPGDVNGDGMTDLLDVQPFVDFILNGGFDAAADLNADGIVDLLDVQPFVDLLLG